MCDLPELWRRVVAAPALRGKDGAGRGLLVADVLVWVMQRRVVLADRTERLRKEFAEIDAEVVRPEAAKVVIGQFIEAERTGQCGCRSIIHPGHGLVRWLPDVPALTPMSSSTQAQKAS